MGQYLIVLPWNLANSLADLTSCNVDESNKEVIAVATGFSYGEVARVQNTLFLGCQDQQQVVTSSLSFIFFKLTISQCPLVAEQEHRNVSEHNIS